MIEATQHKEIQMAGSIKLVTMASAATRALLVGCTLLTAVAVVPQAAAQTATTIVTKHLYPDISSAQYDIKMGLAKARREHKRVLLDFGGDWCGDCQVLDIYFNQAPNSQLLAKNFVKVNINIGHMDANIDVAKKYGVPIHGVPALAVLDANGNVIMAQDHEFSNMRNMEASSVTDFLNKWKR
jgi:thiol:disulfide interchange protein